MLTPQELKKISFSGAKFGGYVMSDVDKVLEPLIADYQTLFEENAELRKQLLLQKERLEHEGQEAVTCKKCESKWISRFPTDCCPFCGAPLKDEPVLDPSSPVSVLSYIQRKYGASVLCDRKLLSYFRDYAPGLQEQAALIGIAVDAGTYAEILALDGVSNDERMHQVLLCKERLKQRKFLADEYAQLTITWLIEALGWAKHEDQPNNDHGKQVNVNVVENKKQKTSVDEKPFQMMDSPSSKAPSTTSNTDQDEEPPSAPFRYRDAKMLEDKFGNGNLSFTIPSMYDGIAENALKGINAESLYIPASIRYIHKDAFESAGPRIKTILFSARNPWFAVKDDKILEKKSQKVIHIPWPIAVRTYYER